MYLFSKKKFGKIGQIRIVFLCWMGSLIAGMVRSWMGIDCRRFLCLLEDFRWLRPLWTSCFGYFELFPRCLMPVMSAFYVPIRNPLRPNRFNSIWLISFFRSPPGLLPLVVNFLDWPPSMFTNYLFMFGHETPQVIRFWGLLIGDSGIFENCTTAGFWVRRHFTIIRLKLKFFNCLESGPKFTPLISGQVQDYRLLVL